ncbi:hypothetical protein WJX84_006636 [Apatococcus fuscideae]|uniref:Uncharacterized protein n=1 Tax=Apatococcus fuscideae TaxID=2026836 RepID=A0AAW1S8Z7_9CHLO
MQLARQAHSCRPDALQHCAPTPLGSCRVRQLNSQATQGRRKSFTKGLGKDAAEGWLDLAKLVSSRGGPKSAFETGIWHLVSLFDVLPSAGIRDMQRIIEDFVRNG